MIVINAYINQAPDFNHMETEHLENKIKALGVDRYFEVSDVPSLLSTLGTYDGQPILLFTNFSPNHFYVKNGIDVNDFHSKAMPNWRVEQYWFSAGLYHSICKEYSIIGIHFITSALKRVVNDTDFLNVTGGIQTTVMRKQDWMKRGMNYEVNLKAYMFHKIREAKKSISAKYVNGEFSLNNPLLQFCQN
jgi:hypothetical protein